MKLLLAASFMLTSPAFHANAPIPRAYTCDGRDVSPPLRWTAPPRGTRSLAIRMFDTDARFTHWLAWGIPARSRGLGAAARPPHQAANDFGRVGYGGPCPPSGTHHYTFTLYALTRPLAPRGSGAAAFGAALKRAHVLARATLTGTYRHA